MHWIALGAWRLPPPSPPLQAGTPAGVHNANIVASQRGGVVESITSEYGPGFTGNRLIDERSDPPWKARDPVTFPQEIVFSFFHRQTALIASMKITLPENGATAPREVEVWTAAENAPDAFKQVATRTLDPAPRDQTISFPMTQARFVKLRVLSSGGGKALGIGKVQILEAQRRGCTPLAERNPDMVIWEHNPNRAAQAGIEWLQAASIEWQKKNQCFGCHSQAQVIMGLALSKKNQYVVSDPCLTELATYTQSKQNADGTFHTSEHVTST